MSERNSQTTADKIRGFGSLVAGWHYGEGGPCPPIAIYLAVRVDAMLREAGYSETDAFPATDGAILVTGYKDGCSVDVEVRDDGRYEPEATSPKSQPQLTRETSGQPQTKSGA